MASRISALNHYRPQIKYGKTVQKAELVELISNRTGLNEGEIMLVLLELRDAIVFFNTYGRGVKLDGLGTYLPNINYQGEYDVTYHMDKGLKQALNRRRGTAYVNNHEHIGKTTDEIVALWNAEHPDDPVR